MRKKKPAVTLPGRVEKIIPTQYGNEPEKAEIAIESADPLYKEIRIENKLADEEGKEVALKPGAEVEITSKLIRRPQNQGAQENPDSAWTAYPERLLVQ